MLALSSSQFDPKLTYTALTNGRAAVRDRRGTIAASIRQHAFAAHPRTLPQ
jgi:hypothetical protein